MVYLRGLSCRLPEHRRTNEDLIQLNPTWDASSIYAKTGIRSRPTTIAGETAADLGHAAAEALFAKTQFDRRAIDAVIFCSQSPDYLLPTTACLLQTRLGIPDSCAAFDINLGCSGFTYGLWTANALIASKSVNNVLLIVGDTYSKYCNPHDKATVTLFADGAAAALITTGPEDALAAIGPTVVGTDGRGGEHLIIRAGGARRPRNDETAQVHQDGSGNQRSDEQLFMNGPEVFAFTLSHVPRGIQQVLDKVRLNWEDVDWFLLHQANRFMLEQLRNKMQIPLHKMPIDLENTGNTVTASLPILIESCIERGIFQPGHRCVLAGFGVGFSWAMTYMQWLGK